MIRALGNPPGPFMPPLTKPAFVYTSPFVKKIPQISFIPMPTYQRPVPPLVKFILVIMPRVTKPTVSRIIS
jgi:hypothetical protein